MASQSDVVTFHFFHNLLVRMDPFEKYVPSVETRLRSYLGDNTDGLKKALQKSGAVISGSFILQCILDEEWKKSDIDIYVPFSPNSIDYLAEYMEFAGLKISGPTNLADYLDKSLCITEIRNFTIAGDDNEPIYQLIYVELKGRSMKELICNTFDFDVCKNIYAVGAMGGSVYCYDVNSVLQKSCDFCHQGRVQSSINRYYKYVHRGFTFYHGDQTILWIYQNALSEKNVQDDCKKNITASKIPAGFLRDLLKTPPTCSSWAIKG